MLQSTYAHPDALFRAQLEFWRWLVEVAPSERAFFEAFFTWVYTPRAHADGSLSQIIEETLAFTYQQSVDAFKRRSTPSWGTTRPTVCRRSRCERW